MQIVTISIKNKDIRDKIIWFLKHLESEGVEIMSQEDIEDLKFLAATRGEKKQSCRASLPPGKQQRG